MPYTEAMQKNKAMKEIVGMVLSSRHNDQGSALKQNIHEFPEATNTPLNNEALVRGALMASNALYPVAYGRVFSNGPVTPLAV